VPDRRRLEDRSELVPDEQPPVRRHVQRRRPRVRLRVVMTCPAGHPWVTHGARGRPPCPASRASACAARTVRRAASGARARRPACAGPAPPAWPTRARAPDSEWVARQLGRPVLKVFNNVLAGSLARGGLPAGAPGRIALPVAGDDAAGKAVVLRLLDELGFDGIDAGSLADSWRQQVGTPACCRDLDADTLRAALAAAEHARVADYRREGEAFARRKIAEAGSVDALAAR
jgi:hypothetical protein